VFLPAARHCHEQPVVTLHDLDVVDSDGVVKRDRNHGAQPSVVHCFSDFNVAYFHEKPPLFLVLLWEFLRIIFIQLL
jgi:hypothetical protein